jgi:aminoglycoside phosphotransferase (APT) family kinase protein
MKSRRLTAEMAHEAYKAALGATDRMAGYYNENYRVDTPLGSVLVRVPIAGCDEMDIRLFPEDAILTLVRHHRISAPEVLFVSDAPAFQILQYVDGVPGNIAFPPGAPVPPHFLVDVVTMIQGLRQIGRDDLPATPPDWPVDGDCAGFLRRLIANTQRVYDESLESFGWLYAQIGIPPDPLDAVTAQAASLASRPFHLCHSDIHRKNVIVDRGKTCFLDWELALLGDPVYDLAVHLHKTSYSPAEEAQFISLAKERLDSDVLVGLASDLDPYRRHERMKSVIVDTVRYRKQAEAPDADPSEIDYLAAKLATKIGATSALWGCPDLSAQAVRGLLTMDPEFPPRAPV